VPVICTTVRRYDRGSKFACHDSSCCLVVHIGHWICSADADDVMLPQRVERQLAAARAAPPKCLLGCRFVREPHDATWHYALWANTTSQAQLWLDQYRECPVVQPTWFYSRSVWESAGAASDSPRLRQRRILYKAAIKHNEPLK
jgi:hypothetical protein